MKSTLKRFLSLVLCMCMVYGAVAQCDHDSVCGRTSGDSDRLELTRTSDLSFTGDADDAWSANGTSSYRRSYQHEWNVAAIQRYHNPTLTITNKKSVQQQPLPLTTAIEQNSGTIQVDGNRGFFGWPVLPRNWRQTRSVKVYIKSGSTSAATKITLTNRALSGKRCQCNCDFRAC